MFFSNILLPFGIIIFLNLLLSNAAPPSSYPKKVLHLNYYEWRFFYNPLDYAEIVLEWHYSDLLLTTKPRVIEDKRLKISTVSLHYLVNKYIKLNRQDPDILKKIWFFTALILNYKFCPIYEICRHHKIRDTILNCEKKNNCGIQFELIQPYGFTCSSNEVIEINEKNENIVEESNFLIFIKLLKNPSFSDFLIKYKKDKDALKKIEGGLGRLFDVVRSRSLREGFSEFFENMVLIEKEGQENFPLIYKLYIEYFETKDKITKWRNKLLIEYIIYREWLCGPNDNGQNNSEGDIYCINSHLDEAWKEISKYYWYGEEALLIIINSEGDEEDILWNIIFKIYLEPEEYSTSQLDARTNPSFLQASLDALMSPYNKRGNEEFKNVEEWHKLLLDKNNKNYS
uniref:Uncharacterized protein n=1 Tax=Meloidogyne enterolobii TaxID=390850 RepID=A0A6V7UJQ7_MELEN|nr:unnamed protein product [Meloidogyne enterolobii]